MKRAILLLLLVLLPALLSCQPASTDSVEYRMELVREIKEFEKTLGFTETTNFLAYSDNTVSYDYFFYTSITELPYSLGDPSLMFGSGQPGTDIDPQQYDIFSYSMQAVAGVESPVTKSLMEAPLSRFIYVIFHEDWHEQIDLPADIEEPSGEAISYAASMLFVENKYGRNSTLYNTFKKELDNKLKESQVYVAAYDKLKALYKEYSAGAISKEDTLDQKNIIIQDLSISLKEIRDYSPDQLNNAFIAFQMTYTRHFPIMEQVVESVAPDMRKAVEIFLAMPAQGQSTSGVEDILVIEAQVLDYLQEQINSRSN